MSEGEMMVSWAGSADEDWQGSGGSKPEIN